MTPNPGSEAALDLGCSCPVLDNAHGRGIPWPREDGKDPEKYPSFWINGLCKLHGTKEVNPVAKKTNKKKPSQKRTPSY